MKFKTIILMLVLLTLAACELEPDDNGGSGDVSADSVTARVVRITDGDTILVEIDGDEYKVRYIGINTPEISHSADQTDDPCGRDATEANRRLVEGQTVRLERDTSNTDRYDRLLRYIYVGDTFVNETLVQEGWAEVVSYPPDTREFDNFRALEQSAESAGFGCHPTGIFNDGTYER